MSHQSEAILERNLIKQLIGLGYESIHIQDGDALLSNLQSQLEAFNKTKFTPKEFDAILNHLAKGNVFEKAKTLRDRYVMCNMLLMFLEFVGTVDMCGLVDRRASIMLRF